VAGIAVASGQLINQSIKLGDVKRAINQSENSLSINQVKALKLELIDYAHLCPNLPFIILSSFLLRDKLNPLTPFERDDVDLYCEYPHNQSYLSTS